MQAEFHSQSDKVRGHAVRWAWLLLILAAFAIYPALTQNIGALSYDAARSHLYQGVLPTPCPSVLTCASVFHLGSPLTFRTPLRRNGFVYRFGLPHPMGGVCDGGRFGGSLS
jgi:hypothetical protein